MYHRIASERFDPWGLAVSPENFREQVAWLRDRRTVISLPEFARRLRAGVLDRDAIVITFDDGYACNLENAAPALRAASLPATVFIVTDAIRNGREFWWDELARLVLAIKSSTLEIALPAGGMNVELGERSEADSKWLPNAGPGTARQHAFYQIWSALRELEPDQQEQALDQVRLLARHDMGPRASHRPMSPGEMRALHCGLIEVGAHSVSHTSLSARTPDHQAEQIADSRSYCASIIGSEPASFAYPFGDFDQSSIRLVEEAGFSVACTTVHAAVTREDSVFTLPRMQVGDWNSATLAQELKRL